MNTAVKNAEIAFRIQVEKLKALKGLSNRELAELLGVSDRTVSLMLKKPLSTSSKNILLVQEYLRREEKKAWD